MCRNSFAFLLLLTAIPVALAHDFWLQPTTFTPAAGKSVSLSLHVGDRFASEGERPYQGKLTVSLDHHSAAGTKAIAAKDGEKPFAHFTPAKAGVHIVALERGAVLITLEGKKFNSYLKEEGLLDALAERKKRGEDDKDGRERYRRYIKCYLRVGDGDATWKQRAGHKLEIVPLSDPTAMKKGDTLKVRVLFDDRPLTNVQVEAFSRADGKVKARIEKTSAKGEASFTLDEVGMALVRLVHMKRVENDKEADWHSWWSAMTFEVK